MRENKVKSFITHAFLIVSTFIILLPVIHMISGGFRANQSMYAPLVQFNGWIESAPTSDVIVQDSGRTVTKENKVISKRRLFKNIKTELALSDSTDSKALLKSVKEWINHKGTGKYKERLRSTIEDYTTANPLMVDRINLALGEGLSKYTYSKRISLINYKVFFTGETPDRKGVKYPIIRWFGNSMTISLTVMVIQVIVIMLAAFAITRYNFSGKKSVIWLIVVLQVFPTSMTMIALYLLLDYLGGIVPSIGLDSIAGLILVYLGAGVPLNIWLSKGYFQTLPPSLEESAKVDGASLWQIFFHIILPLTLPIAAVVGILSFIAAYNEFLLAKFLLTRTENFTLPLGLDFFIYSDNIRYGMFCAISILGSIPVLAMWLFMQKYIVAGLTQSAVKE